MEQLNSRLRWSGEGVYVIDVQVSGCTDCNVRESAAVVVTLVARFEWAATPRQSPGDEVAGSTSSAAAGDARRPLQRTLSRKGRQTELGFPTDVLQVRM